jgi:hypothetical protein
MSNAMHGTDLIRGAKEVLVQVPDGYSAPQLITANMRVVAVPCSV